MYLSVCNQCLLPLCCQFNRVPETRFCDKVGPALGQCILLHTPCSSTYKTHHHKITEIFLKLALTHNPLPNPSWFSVILTLQKIPINLITIIINLKEQSTTQNTMFCLKQLDITNYK